MSEVRRIRAGEWEALRDLRLRALADAPHAFATSLAQARERADEEWRVLARSGASDARWATFVAERDGCLIGMASGHYPDERHRRLDDPEIPSLIQMWVDPAARRQGVGERLVEAVLAWAGSQGAGVVRLTVNPADPGATAFYRSMGFRDTGRSEPMSNDRVAVEMERACRT